MIQQEQSPDNYPLPIVTEDIYMTAHQQFQASRSHLINTAEATVESDAVDFALFCRDIVRLKFGLTDTQPALDHMVIAAELLRRTAIFNLVVAHPEPFLMGRTRNGFFSRNHTKHVLPSMIYGTPQREILSNIEHSQARTVLEQHDYYLHEAITGETFLPSMTSVARDKIVRPTLVLYGLMRQLALLR